MFLWLIALLALIKGEFLIGALLLVYLVNRYLDEK